ncbi:hypothetical protein FB45DRAFT_940402 [Roridomyces roridus]|uniref:DUF4211 domain-containing protein n=1 Tax=Roridomyces roridus TaxID=1738132 RepID=A0AAD7B6J7_9AGAR|nr:hypothetical protein FB45DRAFT_940402 [Roridomyces roridus]
MVHRRRPKHEDLEEQNEDTETPTLRSPRKRLRRQLDSSSESEAEGELPVPSQTGEPSNSDSPSSPKRLCRRQDSTVTPSARNKRTREASHSSDSECNLLERKECLKRRRALNPASASSRGGTRDESSDSDSGAHSEDENDLRLPTPPPRSKPLPKEIRRDAIEKLKDCRNNKGSPTAVRRAVPEDVDTSSSSGLENDSDESTMDETQSERASSENGRANSEDASSDNDFIDDADVSSDEDQKVQKALGIVWYERRSLKQQFMAFIESLVKLNANPDLEGLAGEDELSFKAALNALKIRTRAQADTMQGPTWTGSFKITLDRRPVLMGPVQCEDSDCEACWTRGKFKCSAMGSYTVSTRKGFYDPETFQDIPERGEEYSDRTTRDKGNNAQADVLLYPPGFRLVLGEDCAHRAAAYHQTRHYLYHMAVRIWDEIERVGDLESEDLKDQEGLMERMTGAFGEELWHDFCLDSKQWEMFQ